VRAGSGEFMEVRGMRIRIAIEGQGPPLLLINGLGANIEMWKPLRRLLSHRQTIAFDAPGAGASDQPTKSLLMRARARRDVSGTRRFPESGGADGAPHPAAE
jgi:pimeloyl-ACP methyl ester carboxylesterase